MPHTPCTDDAPTGSSICSLWSMNSMAYTSTIPQSSPITTAPQGDTTSQPAVMPTRPARMPFKVRESEGLPYLNQVTNMVATPPATAARLVVRKTCEMAKRFTSPLAASWLPGLKPNQPSQRINTPSAARARLCPGMARLLPSLPYFPRRGPRASAPVRARMPPTLCTMALPAKSWKPSCDNQPPPQVQ